LPHTRLEAEMSYDFNHVYNKGFTNTNGGSVTFVNTGIGALHGLFGPKSELGHKSFRPFLELKGGFVNYQVDARPASFDTFTSSLQNLRSQNINGVVTPGEGWREESVRWACDDVGDEMYFNNAPHHNLKVLFGPYVRF
jgi:hypothetical protein